MGMSHQDRFFHSAENMEAVLLAVRFQPIAPPSFTKAERYPNHPVEEPIFQSSLFEQGLEARCGRHLERNCIYKITKPSPARILPS